MFKFLNIADMWVYSLFVKFSMVCYFNDALFKVAYSMLRVITVALLMPYCLLAFNVSFFSDIICNFVLLNAVLLCWNFYILFLDNSSLYATLIKDRFPMSSAKEFLYQLVCLATNW